MLFAVKFVFLCLPYISTGLLYNVRVYDCPEGLLVLDKNYTREMAASLSNNLGRMDAKYNGDSWSHLINPMMSIIRAYGLNISSDLVDECELAFESRRPFEMNKNFIDFVNKTLNVDGKKIFSSRPDREHEIFFEVEENKTLSIGCAYQSEYNGILEFFTHYDLGKLVEKNCTKQLSIMKYDKGKKLAFLTGEFPPEIWQGKVARFNRYVGHPVIIIPSSGRYLRSMLCKLSHEDKYLSYDLLIDSLYGDRAHRQFKGNITAFVENFSKWVDCMKLSILKNDSAEVLTKDMGQLRYNDLSRLTDIMIKGDTRIEPGTSLQVAPYDIRKTPYQLDDYYEDLKKLIVRTYEKNGGRKVALMTFYTGGIYAFVFLSKVPQDFKDRYIASLTTIGMPFRGTRSAFAAFEKAYGHDKTEEQDSFEDPAFLRNLAPPNVVEWYKRKQLELQILMPSTLVAFPTKFEYYQAFKFNELSRSLDADTVRVVRKNLATFYENYTSFNAYNIYKYGPGVEFHCIYGINVATPDTYNSSVTTSGDGVVPADSAGYCSVLKRRPNGAKRVIVSRIDGLRHTENGIDTGNETIFEMIIQRLYNIAFRNVRPY